MGRGGNVGVIKDGTHDKDDSKRLFQAGVQGAIPHPLSFEMCDSNRRMVEHGGGG